MKRSINPLLAALIIAAAVIAAFYVTYRKSVLPPPLDASKTRAEHLAQREVEQSPLDSLPRSPSGAATEVAESESRAEAD